MDKEKKGLLQNSEIYKALSGSLMQGERVLWWGSTAKGAKLKDKGNGAAKSFVCFAMALMPILLLVPAMKYGGPLVTLAMLIMPVIFVWIGVSMLSGTKKDYAITNKRIFSCDGDDIQAESIAWISDVEFQANEKNIGSVTFRYVYPGGDAKSGGIYGIEDPEEVCRILIEASEKLKAEENEGVDVNGQ